jgi:hypothetical protein
MQTTHCYRLMEQMYPVSEVEALLDELSRLVRANVRQEFGALIGEALHVTACTRLNRLSVDAPKASHRYAHTHWACLKCIM